MIDQNSAFIEQMYFEYLRNPQSVSQAWREYFENKHDTPPEIIKSNVGEIPKHEIPNSYIPKEGETLEALLSISAKIAGNMEESIQIPTATSVRAIPVKVLDENRRIINRFLEKVNRSKVSFTQIMAWAVVRALKKYPALNDAFASLDGKPYRIRKSSINFGFAVDITKKDGTRLLLVPNIKHSEKMSFSQFIEKYEELIAKAKSNKLDIDDLQETTITLTNPGMIGTTHSNPRLMKGQGTIIATGSIEYPAEFQAVRPEMLTTLAVSKVVTITNTYDHRIIQGAESAEFLAFINKLLLGKEQFYDQIFFSLGIPFEPVRWTSDLSKLPSNGMFADNDREEKGAHVMLLINAFRVRGHLLASINPLGLESYYYPELDPAYYGFTMWDFDRLFHADDTWQNNNLPLRDIIETLRETYCGHLGYEFMHIQDPMKKDWIKRKLEPNRGTMEFSKEEKLRIFDKLANAEFFENYLHTKFVGHKRFSLEGAESVIVMLDKLFNLSADNKLDSIVLGMAHRGRLNVLVNNIGKAPEKIFNEFEGDFDPDHYQGSGDVKYHLGDKGKFISVQNNSINVLLAPNPSHLEIVDPVIVGMARAIDNEIGDTSYTRSIPIIIHGDAAFAGQGVVAETLNLSQLDGYKTGGSIHIIINNQIGFTTSSDSARSTIYATDIAKMIQTPILHVNGNDPEAVCAAATFAFEYRNTFKSDVIIDMLCYRKYGHNEGDEPTYTQPLLYKKIKKMQPVSKLYESRLLREKSVSKEEIASVYTDFKQRLDKAFDGRKEKRNKEFVYLMKEGKAVSPYFTAVAEDRLKLIAEKITEIPKGFKPNPKVVQLLKKRRDMIESSEPAIDWAMGEALGLASILLEGRSIRFTGQDSRRGTFSQRHSVLTDIENETRLNLYDNIQKDQGYLRIWDSPLSEAAVLGFEYGYSVVAANDLTLWEAQFGDFTNNAQIVTDQFITCAEVKWGQTSNLVMLLPHSYDGQGPEHSSARLERFLQMCSEDNMIVGNFTTPAQYFHALRRQIFMTFKLPMILMTPKSMLRHPKAVSSLKDFSHGEFMPIIDDETANAESIKRVLFCTGKVYYDLLEKKTAISDTETAIVRIEQLYPLHKAKLTAIVEKYKHAELVWVQEEPKNMGAWQHILINSLDLGFGHKLKYIGRKEGAATATGSFKRHQMEQTLIAEQAFSPF